jgi:endonuclease/exonuclease/phosphatase family metal-dependent hydrolase
MITPSVEWIGPSDAAERKAHASWRKGVGPPLVLETPEPRQGAKRRDSLVIVSWNTHVGGADLDAFIQELRSGKLASGEPIHDFVLLLQEVFRAGPAVPVSILPEIPTGSYLRFAPPTGERVDIVKTARQHGLSLFYVPLMRNGRPEESHIPEDRGNAILSTMPLSSFTVVELPHVRQRRLAIGAILSGETTAGSSWSIRVVSVHLENRAKWSEVLHSFGRARLRQVKALVEAYSTGTPTIVGGDFNTWSDEWDEPAIRHMEQSFDRPASSDFGTVKRTFLFPERMVDYLFFRLPKGWTGAYQRVGNLYGSDHYPLLGRVQIRGEE